MWPVKSLTSMVSANEVVAFGWDGGECGGQCSCREREMLHNKRNSNLCNSETPENTHMSKVGGRGRH